MNQEAQEAWLLWLIFYTAMETITLEKRKPTEWEKKYSLSAIHLKEEYCIPQPSSEKLLYTLVAFKTGTQN